MTVNTPITPSSGATHVAAFATRPKRQRHRFGNITRVAPLVFGLVIITVAWQVITKVANAPVYIFPAPTDVFLSIQDQPELLWSSILITLQSAVIGLLAAIVAGIIVATLLAFSPILERTFFPYAVVLQTTPIIATAPLVVIWFGPDIESIYVIVFLMCFFPMLSGTLQGLNAVDADLRSLFHIYDASPLQTMFKLRLPNAIPYALSGLRVASGLSVVGAIVGEYVAGVGGAQGGLGYLLSVAAAQLNTPYLVAAALSGAALGLIFFGIVSLVGIVLVSWHDPGAYAAVKGGSGLLPGAGG
jgi:NitT/TauT family transport system permease protein